MHAPIILHLKNAHHLPLPKYRDTYLQIDVLLEQTLRRNRAIRRRSVTEPGTVTTRTTSARVPSDAGILLQEVYPQLEVEVLLPQGGHLLLVFPQGAALARTGLSGQGVHRRRPKAHGICKKGEVEMISRI